MTIELNQEEADCIRFCLRTIARRDDTTQAMSDKLHSLADKLLSAETECEQSVANLGTLHSPMGLP
jgi:hypothetical protein